MNGYYYHSVYIMYVHDIHSVLLKKEIQKRYQNIIIAKK